MTVGADGNQVFDTPEKRRLALVRSPVVANRHCLIGDDFFAFGTPEVVAHEHEFAQFLPRFGGVPLPGWNAFIRDPQRFGHHGFHFAES